MELNEYKQAAKFIDDFVVGHNHMFKITVYRNEEGKDIVGTKRNMSRLGPVRFANNIVNNDIYRCDELHVLSDSVQLVLMNPYRFFKGKIRSFERIDDSSCIIHMSVCN